MVHNWKYRIEINVINVSSRHLGIFSGNDKGYICNMRAELGQLT